LLNIYHIGKTDEMSTLSDAQELNARTYKYLVFHIKDSTDQFEGVFSLVKYGTTNQDDMVSKI